MTTPEKARDRLLAKLNASSRQLKVYDSYFEGDQPMRFLSPVLKKELGDRITEIILNWPRFGVEAYDNRLDIEGFRFSGGDSSDADLWRIWQANDGDLISQQAHQEHLALSRAYSVVGNGDDAETPLITVHSPFEAIHEDNPRTHDIENGILQWTEADRSRWVNLYHPNGRITWRRDKSSWVEDSHEDNEFKLSRMTPLINQPRMLGRHRPGLPDQRLGRSIFHDIIPIADAANKMATDMMVSAEFHAMPRRWAVGLSEDDFTDEAGNALGTWELVAGRLWASENKDVKMGQFAESDLKVFHESIKLLAQLASQMLALPPHYLSFTGDNPASADAIRSSETQLVKRAERMQSLLSTRWERVQRLVLLTKTGKDAPEARQIETMWRDPSTPTIAQKADAIVKLVQAKDSNGHSILPVQQAREDLGYSATVQGRMADWDTQNATDPQVAAASRQLQAIGAPAVGG